MSHVLLVQGTALALPLKDASVHCCVCSPPYYGLRDYGTGTWQGGDAGCDHRKGPVPFSAKALANSTIGAHANTNHASEGYKTHCGRCSATRVDQQLGLEESVDAYVEAMVQVFREVRRVLHPTGTCWINIGDAMRDKQLQGLPWRLALAMQQDGWVLRSEIIWHKRSAMPESVSDRPTRAHEQVFLFAKSPRYFYDAEAAKEKVGELTRRKKEFRGVSVYKNHLADGVSNHVARPEGKSTEGVESFAGRNCRSVWSLTSEPTGFQHYAAFPTQLVRRCLLAGAPTQVCAACGAPWKREVCHGPPSKETTRGQQAWTQVTGQRDSAGGLPLRAVHTTGFAPTCACAADTQPATVLDPFCGSGTTLLVARELGPHAIGLDLSYPYLHDIARKRLGLADLARWEGRNGHPTPTPVYTDLPLFAAGGV